MELSYRQQLAKIGEPGQGKTPPPWPSGFYVKPTSLRLTMQAMESLHPEKWIQPSDTEGIFPNEDWTEECQGVTHDKTWWYLSSNHEGLQRIYRMLPLTNEIKGFVELAGNGSDHVGDIDYHDGWIYCAMEQPIKVVRINATSFDGYSPISIVDGNGGAPPQGDSMPWCAFNPWNGLLYSSRFGDDPDEWVTEIFGYRLEQGKFVNEPKATIRLQKATRRIQGGCFSSNGHLLITSDFTNDIRCYSVLNGAYMGSAGILKSGGFPNYQEIEGVCIWDNQHYLGIATHIHVILLDNDKPDSDDVYFKHYNVPDWQYL